MSTQTSLPSLPALRRRLLDSVPGGIILLGPEGRVVHVNPPAARLLGEEERAACVGLDLCQLFPELPGGLPGRGEASGDSRNWTGWPRNRRREEGALEVSAHPGDDWLPGGVLLSLTRAIEGGDAVDPEGVGRRRRTEEALEESRRYLAMITHELRTPLGAVLGLAQTLDDTELSLDQRQLLRTLEDSARGMSQLLNGIYDLARMNGGTLEPAREGYSVPDMVESVAFALGGRAAEKELEVSVEVQPSVPWLLLGDLRLLRQLLMNLGANALKFTERGGIHLAVRMGESRADGDVEVVFEVSDTGPGIPPEMQERIFEPFIQGPEAVRKESGSGIGLAVVRGTVERMGGRVELESTPGRGSCFRLVVPHGTSDRPCPRRRQSDRKWPDTAVLVTGGSRRLRKGIEAAVVHMGSRMEHVSADRLLDHVRAVDAPRALVLLDHSLGQEQVARLAAAARAASPPSTHVEVVALVSQGTDPWVDAAGRSLPCLLKPVVRRRLAVFMSSEPPAMAAPSTAEGPRRVLVVEDDHGIRVLYRRFLPRALGVEVTEAATVKDALAEVALRPDLALVDMSLPDGEGVQVARALRERWGDRVLVVATSGFEEATVAPLVRDGTFDAFLPKPSPLDQIETLLGDLLSREQPRRPSGD